MSVSNLKFPSRILSINASRAATLRFISSAANPRRPPSQLPPPVAGWPRTCEKLPAPAHREPQWRTPAERPSRRGPRRRRRRRRRWSGTSGRRTRRTRWYSSTSPLGPSPPAASRWSSSPTSPPRPPRTSGNDLNPLLAVNPRFHAFHSSAANVFEHFGRSLIVLLC